MTDEAPQTQPDGVVSDTPQETVFLNPCLQIPDGADSSLMPLSASNHWTYDFEGYWNVLESTRRESGTLEWTLQSFSCSDTAGVYIISERKKGDGVFRWAQELEQPYSFDESRTVELRENAYGEILLPYATDYVPRYVESPVDTLNLGIGQFVNSPIGGDCATDFSSAAFVPDIGMVQFDGFCGRASHFYSLEMRLINFSLEKSR